MIITYRYTQIPFEAFESLEEAFEYHSKQYGEEDVLVFEYDDSTHKEIKSFTYTNQPDQEKH